MPLLVVAVVLAASVLLSLGAMPPAPAPPVLAGNGLPAQHALLLPVRYAVMSQGYGCTSFEFEPVASNCPGGHFHAGVDLAAPMGADVLATAGGTVAFAAWTPDGYGLRLVIDHGHGLTTLYAHLEETLVAPGDAVSAGQRVGLVGSTGNSTGPHLHFEVRSNGRPTDPEPLLAAIPSRGGTQ